MTDNGLILSQLRKIKRYVNLRIWQISGIQMFKSVTSMELSCDRTGQTHRRTQPFLVKDRIHPIDNWTNWWYFNTITTASPDEKFLSLACDCLVSPQSLSVERICVTWLVGARHQPRSDWLITRSPLLLPVKQTVKHTQNIIINNWIKNMLETTDYEDLRSQLLHSALYFSKWNNGPR